MSSEMASGEKTQEGKSNFELPTELPFDFLKKITDDFSDKLIISSDPFGKVYKGIVPYDGRVISVKKLQENAPMPADRTFQKEVQNVMALKHENITRIIGYCSERSKKLVQFDKRYIQADITETLICYEYFPNGNLKENLFGTTTTVNIEDWDTRFKMIKGVCQGLRYLHKLDIPIVHMDLKPENILLDAKMVPKIANFALSRVFGQEQTRLCTQTVVGSYGYMAPEYLYRGEISAQSDIYSLGLMIIEIATREQNCPEENQPSARKFIEKVQNNWTPVHIGAKYSSLNAECLRQVKVCIEIGLECVNIDRKSRPPIEKIVARLHSIS
ncbi:unnamed protein product [Alopecurus aequalis]